MTIRHAKYSDLDSLSEIEAASYPAAEGASRESISDRLLTFPSHFWLMCEGEKILGFINGMTTDLPDLSDEMYENAGMHDENGRWQMIFSVVTSPEYRGRGVASRLMEQVISDVRGQKRLGIVLTCKEKLIPFYSRFGFASEGLSSSVHGNAQWYQMRLKFN
ncbi:MAG: GNAT family N-acetyltransferase [Eubacteriales bacterium]